jgi:hypothetical protein
MYNGLMATLLIAAATLGLFACGAAPASRSGNGSTADPAIGIADLKFYDGDKLGAHLHPDGSLEILAAGGADDWHIVGTLNAAGTLTTEHGKAAPIESVKCSSASVGGSPCAPLAHAPRQARLGSMAARSAPVTALARVALRA